jgi:hypothetical protein
LLARQRHLLLLVERALLGCARRVCSRTRLGAGAAPRRSPMSALLLRAGCDPGQADR